MRLFQRRSPSKGSEADRQWPVTACGRLLLIQGLGLFFLAWVTAPTNSQPTIIEAWLAITFALLGLFALLNSRNFLGMQANGRNRAMLLQGLLLGLALFLYFGQKPVFIYGIMVYAIFMVIYMQHPDVLASFPIDTFPGDRENRL